MDIDAKASYSIKAEYRALVRLRLTRRRLLHDQLS